MGWRGAGGVTATVYVALIVKKETTLTSRPRGANYFFGGMLLIIAGILEFFLGNTFPTVVFLGTSPPPPSSSSQKNNTNCNRLRRPLPHLRRNVPALLLSRISLHY